LFEKTLKLRVCGSTDLGEMLKRMPGDDLTGSAFKKFRAPDAPSKMDKTDIIPFTAPAPATASNHESLEAQPQVPLSQQVPLLRPVTPSQKVETPESVLQVWDSVAKCMMDQFISIYSKPYGAVTETQIKALTLCLIPGLPPPDFAIIADGMQFPLHKQVIRNHFAQPSDPSTFQSNEIEWNWNDRKDISRTDAAHIVIALYSKASELVVDQDNFEALAKLNRNFTFIREKVSEYIFARSNFSSLLEKVAAMCRFGSSAEHLQIGITQIIKDSEQQPLNSISPSIDLPNSVWASLVQGLSARVHVLSSTPSSTTSSPVVNK
jgi:hypothetical protein